VFGTGDDIEIKFEKLMLFYKEGLSRVGWDKYSTINLKYKNQIVCTKK
jgi:cell division protein FtsQ